MRSLIKIPLALALLCAPGLAAASSSYPDAIKTDLALTYAPPCTVCHQTNSGGTGTATQAFATAMRQRGLTGGSNTGSLSGALQALEGEKTDSDCNGTPDIAQLEGGQDPNTGLFIDGSGKTGMASAGCAGGDDNPRYGCGAQLAAAPVADSSPAIIAAVATVLGLALSRRRRRA